MITLWRTDTRPFCAELPEQIRATRVTENSYYDLHRYLDGQTSERRHARQSAYKTVHETFEAAVQYQMDFFKQRREAASQTIKDCTDAISTLLEMRRPPSNVED